MNTTVKLFIVAALAGAVTAAVVLKRQHQPVTPATPALAGPIVATTATKPLPKLVDLGADRCIPCRKMAPILEELKKEKADVFVTEFIDVWKNPDAGKQYNIDLIPTQIFFDDTGKELFRHQGFFSKEDILAKWRELGVK